MPLALNDLTTLDQATVQTNLLTIAQIVQEAYPTLTLRRGAFHDLVLLLSAVLNTNDSTLVQRAINSLSLQQIIADPTLADDDIVDAVLSNFRITRNPGSPATGTAQVILNSLVGFSVPAGFTFTANGLIYTSNATYNAKTDQSQVIQATDVLITALGATGKYAFNIQVTATTDGAAGNLSRGTQLNPTPALSVSVFKVVTFQTFSGGTDAETNSALVTRLSSGAGEQALANRITNQALLETQFPIISALSQVGFGDPEMFRDEHTIWPGHMGGRVDIYTRSSLQVGSTPLSKTATLVAKTGPVGTWQFSLTRSDAPGFYKIQQISQAGTLNTGGNNYAVTSDVRGFDISGPGFIPDIATVLEATYSPYSTSTIQFQDPDTDASGMTINVNTRPYDVAVAVLPQLDTIQAFVNQRSIQWPAGDVLIKAPVPCFVTIALTVQVAASQPTPSVTAIQNAAAEAVNGVSFTSNLTASVVTAAVVALLSGGTVSTITLNGSIRRPDGTLVTLGPSSVALTTPTDPANLDSPNTVAYFAGPGDIAVTVVTV
jgi:Baseplate J-like protein